jgi:hypothetical protein
MATPPKKKAAAPKGQREADQVRQIGMSHRGKVSSSMSGGHPVVSITCFGVDPESPQTGAMLRAIEFVIRGQFDRGRAYQGMTQFTAKTRVIDVVVRCIN